MNQQTTPIAQSDAKANLEWQETYAPYGKRLLQQSKDNQQWYTGKTEDQETGFIYLNARYYDPDIARFISPDPVHFTEQNPMSFNRYEYANNNPMKFVDPTGMETEIIIWQPVGRWSSSFGHVSTNINGMAYSFCPAGMTIKPNKEYMLENSFRMGVGTILNIDSKQENTLGQCLRKPQEKYSSIFNNCAGLVQSCLSSAGVSFERSILPISFGNELIDRGLGSHYSFYGPTKPRGKSDFFWPLPGSAAPWAR